MFEHDTHATPYAPSPESAADACSSPPSGFARWPLAPALLRALDALGFHAPTPVQAQTIPAALEGGDWMVSSQTGSGKTCAFLLPTLHNLIGAHTPSATDAARLRRSVTAPRALVLCPTRELAQQVAAEAIRLLRFSRGVRVATVTGGTAFGKQLMDLRNAALVVATPGRLLDLARNRQIDLSRVTTLIVDEADRMLDLGFSEDLTAIHEATAARQATLMFSATFAPRIMALAEAVMREPQRIELATTSLKHDHIEQHLHWADSVEHKNALLEHYLRSPELTQAIVFASTQVECDDMAEQLRDAGYNASALHGAMPQTVRTRRIAALREGKTQILVATDVAARGIDVAGISLVVNYGLPLKPEDYIHRIGRTGRAGRNGTAVTLVGSRNRRDGFRVRDIERLINRRLAPTVVPGLEPSLQPEAPRAPNRRPHPTGRGLDTRGGRDRDAPARDLWRPAPRGHEQHRRFDRAQPRAQNDRQEHVARPGPQSEPGTVSRRTPRHAQAPVSLKAEPTGERTAQNRAARRAHLREAWARQNGPGSAD